VRLDFQKLRAAKALLSQPIRALTGELMAEGDMPDLFYGGRAMTPKQHSVYRAEIAELIDRHTKNITREILRAQAQREITRQASERVITDGCTRKFLLCTASFGTSYPNPLKG
jgi:hypothetical protein